MRAYAEAYFTVVFGVCLLILISVLVAAIMWWWVQMTVTHLPPAPSVISVDYIIYSNRTLYVWVQNHSPQPVVIDKIYLLNSNASILLSKKLRVVIPPGYTWLFKLHVNLKPGFYDVMVCPEYGLTVVAPFRVM